MNINYQRANGGCFPTMSCAVCKKRIDVRGHNAIVIWKETGEVEVVHQGECSRQMTWREGYPYWEPLVVFIRNLLHNTGVTAKMLKEKDPFEEMFGVVTVGRGEL
jgi:hypothetical protein